MATTHWKEGWKFASTMSGEQCVITDLILMMLKSFVTRYPCHLMVGVMHAHTYVCMYTKFVFNLYTGSLVFTGAAFGSGDGPVFIESLTCEGNEMSILDCREINLRRQSCTHARDVSVKCIGKIIMIQCYNYVHVHCCCRY